VLAVWPVGTGKTTALRPAVDQLRREGGEPEADHRPHVDIPLCQRSQLTAARNSVNALLDVDFPNGKPQSVSW
jgi:hypothetical protein